MGLTQGWLVLGSWLVIESGSRLAHETKKTRLSKTASSSPFKTWTSTPVFRSRLPWTVQDGVAKRVTTWARAAENRRTTEVQRKLTAAKPEQPSSISTEAPRHPCPMCERAFWALIGLTWDQAFFFSFWFFASLAREGKKITPDTFA